ncbi:MAG: YggS family pyridoxal phosphate-dependent enzyme [Candidatus Krumholzibacteriia bacterium]
MISPADVAANLARVRERMAAACARSGRPEDQVRLVAVCKRIPLELVVAACAQDQWELGESRIQEAVPRQRELAARLVDAGLDPGRVQWHFVGHLQRNKASRAVGAFRLLHGVDSLRLAEKLSERATAANVVQPVLMQVDVAREPQKHGVSPADFPAVLDEMAALPQLELRGLMCMAALDAPPDDVRATFATLRQLAEDARRATGLPLPELSMGMTDDFELAIAEGSTMIRVGTAVFGPRLPA